MATGVKKKNGPCTYRMIDTGPALFEFAEALSCANSIAVDLEADSMHHYREKVCLIQIADTSRCAVIDPLKIDDMSPLAPVFSNPRIQKVFHGADYDVRSLYRDFQFDICNLFDTELACRFLGVRESGLESVLHHRFNVRLDKKYQRKDWSLRPLPEEMAEYAASDVYYLIPLAGMLQKELEKKKRSAWVAEECRLLSRVRPPSTNGEPLHLKFKGAGRLEPRSLAVLDALLALRDRIAAQKDRPHYKILGNASLKEMAALKSSNLKELEAAGVLSRKQIGMYGNEIRDAIHRALSLPESGLPVYPRKSPSTLTSAVRKRMKTLRNWRDRKGAALDLDPSILLSKAQIAAIARINPKERTALDRIQEIKTWQRETFGGEIVQALKNRFRER